ncbi:Sugar transporter [Penicillium alfredii]|uniref:Sugar transporter n=1 Tax=Penicillium alfredii TaxID=1506179 RepID=A0A9W9GC62_9EURO|nr:Sugar transporter [Penicillium alfredii]KAJ5115492.1 Sugar transporter [Penicillium alfredii]
MPVLRVTPLGMSVQFLQQITGTNSILYYTVSLLFERGGITDPRTANLATGGVGIVLFVSSWVSIFFFDQLGRKTWLEIGTVGMAGAMVGITVLQSHAESHPGDSAKYMILMFSYRFYVFFNISWGVGSWTYAAEIFTVSMRAKGNALTTASLWAALGTRGRMLEEMSPVFGIESQLAERSGVKPTHAGQDRMEEHVENVGVAEQ